MSLLEDVFLEDEAGEAQDLERIIEGDDIEDEGPRSPDSNENSEREDEAEEDKRRVDPSTTKKVKVVKNPRFILNPARLTGPRGIQIIPEHFKDFKFKGKGHEKEDLDMVLKKLEHWAYRLYPKFQFADCLKKIETLGKKRPVMFSHTNAMKVVEQLAIRTKFFVEHPLQSSQHAYQKGKSTETALLELSDRAERALEDKQIVHLHKIRSDQFQSEETVEQKDSSDDDELVVRQAEDDEFDKLLQQQIEIARITPAPGSANKNFGTPVGDGRTPMSFHMPKATSSPSISEEQRERILRNKQLAEERRLARLTNNSLANGPKGDTVDLTSNQTMKESNAYTDLTIKDSKLKKHVEVESSNNIVKITAQESSDSEEDITNAHHNSVSVEVHNVSENRKHKKSNIIDSSDDHDETVAQNQIIEVVVNKEQEQIEVDKLSDESDKENVTSNINSPLSENVEVVCRIVYKKTISSENTDIMDNHINTASKEVNDNILSIRDEEHSLNLVRDTETQESLVEGDMESIVEAIDILKENNKVECNTKEIDTELIYQESERHSPTYNINSDKEFETRDIDSTKNCETEVSDEIMDVDFTEDF